MGYTGSLLSWAGSENLDIEIEIESLIYYSYISFCKEIAYFVKEHKVMFDQICMFVNMYVY